MRNYILIVLVVVLSGLSGCGRLKPQRLIDETLRVPPAKVVIFFVDGVDRGVYREMLGRGELPNIEKYLIKRGVRAGDTLAPMVIAGPGLRRGGSIEAARAMDLAPMAIEMIEPAKLKEYQFDGRSRLGQLEQTEK